MQKPKTWQYSEEKSIPVAGIPGEMFLLRDGVQRPRSEWITLLSTLSFWSKDSLCRAKQWVEIEAEKAFWKSTFCVGISENTSVQLTIACRIAYVFPRSKVLSFEITACFWRLLDEYPHNKLTFAMHWHWFFQVVVLSFWSFCLCLQID